MIRRRYMCMIQTSMIDYAGHPSAQGPSKSLRPGQLFPQNGHIVLVQNHREGGAGAVGDGGAGRREELHNVSSLA